MDLLCLRCGENWELDYVVNGEPQAFERNGCVVRSCPWCRERPPELSPTLERRLRVLAEIAADHGDDVDAFAAFLDECGPLITEVE